jgi:hypothetical protein
MKVYQNISPRFGRGIQRVAAAIEQFAPPDVQFVKGLPHYESTADLVIHHVIGVQNFHERQTIDQLIQLCPKPRHAVIQYCVATTEQPLPIWWENHVWRHCDLVWSYYDIAEMLAYDHLSRPTGNVIPWVYHALLDRPKVPIYTVCTSGYIPETEGVLECVEAAAKVGGRVLHLGPKSLNLGPHVSYAEGITDAHLAALYKSCRYVAGLRRVEGFELPAAEGLCGGAIPICFDQPHYRRWFEDAAHYVPEVASEVVTGCLESLFRHSTRRLDPVDVSLAQRKFSWPRVVGGFWERVLHPVQMLSPAGRLPDEIPHTPTEAELADLHRPDDEIAF